jgi:hypothetical protein
MNQSLLSLPPRISYLGIYLQENRVLADPVSYHCTLSPVPLLVVLRITVEYNILR